MPASKDAPKIAILEVEIKSYDSKANPLKNIDMVNPIPPKNPIPTICFQFTPEGRFEILNFTDK